MKIYKALGPVHIWRLLFKHMNGRPNYDQEWSSTYVVTKIMMYDVLLQIIEIFPYNDGKISDHQLENNINESIYGGKYPIIGLYKKFVASRLHQEFVSIYDVMMVYQVPGYQDYDVLWQSRYLVLEGPNL